MKKGKNSPLTRQQKLSVLMAAVNGFSGLAPLAPPLAAALAEAPLPRREEVDAAWLAGLQRGGQILDSLLFSTAYAGVTLTGSGDYMATVTNTALTVTDSATITYTGNVLTLMGNCGQVLIESGGQVTGSSNGMYFDSVSNTTASLSGTVSGASTAGVYFNGGDHNTVIVDGGSVLSSAGSGIILNGGTANTANTVTVDSGTVSGGVAGIAINGGVNNTVYINGGTVTGGAYGISDSGYGDSVNIAGGSVSGGTTGISVTGDSGTVTVAGGAVTGGTYGISDSGYGDIVNIAGGTVSGGSAALYVDGTSDQVNVSGSATVSGIIVDGTSNTVNVVSGTVSGMSMSGTGNALNIQNGGTVVLAAGSSLIGATNDSGVISLSGASGAFTLSDLALSGGTVSFAANQTAGRSLTVGGLSGTGSFSLYANLASGYADCITVTGSASGSYQLYITTTGEATGVGQIYKVVDLPTGSSAIFTCSGGGDVGAYRYTVARGSALSASLAAEDYYFSCAGPSAVSLAAIGLTANNSVMWYGEMNEIKKRLGELRMGQQSSDDVWARTYAEKFSVRPAGGESFEQIMHGVEIGKDNPQAFNGGKKYTGFVLGTGKATDTFANGSGTAYSTYLGAYASWLRDDGTYLDLIGKYNWFSHSFATASDSGSYYNRGLGLSAEIGKRFQRGNGYFVEPALELAALWSTPAAYTTDNGLAVSVPSNRSLQLRLGCTVGRKWQGADGAQREFYGKAGWVNEYAGDSTTTVDSAAFDSSLKGHQWVTGLGYVEDTKKHQVYVDLEKSWGNTTSKEWGLNVGYRWKF